MKTRPELVVREALIIVMNKSANVPYLIVYSLYDGLATAYTNKWESRLNLLAKPNHSDGGSSQYETGQGMKEKNKLGYLID